MEELWLVIQKAFEMNIKDRMGCFDTVAFSELFKMYTPEGLISTYKMWVKSKRVDAKIGDVLVIDFDDGGYANGICIDKTDDCYCALFEDKSTQWFRNDEVIGISGHINFNNFFRNEDSKND